VDAVVEDRAELRRAVPQARVAVDADRHLDPQRRVLPLRVALPRRQALAAGGGGHRGGTVAPGQVIDPWVKTGQAHAVEPDRRLAVQGEERKQQLIDCAAVLFAERGYAETRVIDIVRAAGVAKGLFYWYFENKEALFKELAQSIRLQLRRTQGEVLDPDALPLVNIYRGAEVSVAFMAEHAHFFSLLEVEGPNFTEV